MIKAMMMKFMNRVFEFLKIKKDDQIDENKISDKEFVKIPLNLLNLSTLTF